MCNKRFEPLHEKPCFRGFRPCPTQTGCTATKGDLSLEISDLESRDIVLCSKNKGSDQLHGDADLLHL